MVNAASSEKNPRITVVLRLTLRYGTESSFSGLSKAGDFLPIMMTRGTKQLSRQQLQDPLDQNLAVLSARARQAKRRS